MSSPVNLKYTGLSGAALYAGRAAPAPAPGPSPPPPPAPSIVLSATGNPVAGVAFPVTVTAANLTGALVTTPANVTGTASFSPTTVNPAPGELVKLFNATWASAGAASIRATAAGGVVSNTLAVTVAAAPASATIATMSGGTGSATTNLPNDVIVTLNGPVPSVGYTASLARSGVAGSLASSSLVFTFGGATVLSTTNTNTADGTGQVALSGAGLTPLGTPQSYTSSTVTSTGDLPSTTTLTPSVTGTLPFAFAQPFKQGAVVASARLAGLQLDPLTYWPDGSIKHAIVSGTLAMTSGTPAALAMTIGAAATGTTITTTDLATALTAGVTITAGAFGSAVFGSGEWASPQQIVATGPRMSSWLYRKQIGSDTHLVAWLEIRMWSTGAVEVFPWVENGYLGVASPTNKNATYTFTLGGTLRFSQAIDIKHHTRPALVNTSTGEGDARTFTHWLGTSPGVVPAHDGPYLSATKIIQNLAWGPPSGTVLDATQQTYTPNTLAGDVNANGEPGGSGSIISETAARYVTSSGDVRAWKAMMAHGLSSGSWSHHYRDDITQRAFRFVDWPQIRLKETDVSQSVPLIPVGTGGEVAGTGGYGGPAMTHAPGYAYVPFLVTGRWWFLEELHFWATYAYGNMNRFERGGAAGNHDTAQTRGRAWGLNMLAQAATLTPTSHALYGEFVASWNSNTARQRGRYVDGTIDGGTWVSPQGFLGEYSSDGNSGYGFPADLLSDRNFWYAPGWMHNYQAAVLGYTSDIGIPQSAQSLLDHIAVRNHAYKQQIQRAGTGLAGAYNWRRFIVYAYPIGSDKTGLPVDAYFTAAQSYAEMMIGFGLNGSLSATPGLSLKRTAVITTGEDDLTAGSGSLDFASYGLAALALAVEHGAPGAKEGYERIYGASNYTASFQTHLTDVSSSWAIKPRTPAYIAGLAPFQARSLTGTYAPSNGKTTMVDVTSNDWLVNDPGVGGLDRLITAWCGGAKGHDFLDIQGGGHEDSANNGNYRFDLRGDAKPTGWSVFGQSLIADVQPAVSGQFEEYLDGRPSAIHSYDGLITANNGHIYRFGGAKWGASGSFTGRVYSIDPSTGVWTRRADYSASVNGNQPCAVYDPATNKVFVMFATQFEGKFYNVEADTFSAAKATTAAVYGLQAQAWDATRGRSLIISNVDARLATLNFSAETVSFGAALTGDIATLVGRGLSLVGRDPVADCYWAVGGAVGDAGWNRLYRIHAGTMAVTEHLLTGDAMTVQTQVGSFGRWAANWVWRAIAILPGYTQPVTVIRLPNS